MFLLAGGGSFLSVSFVLVAFVQGAIIKSIFAMVISSIYAAFALRNCRKSKHKKMIYFYRNMNLASNDM